MNTDATWHFRAHAGRVMRINRVYVDAAIDCGRSINLPQAAAHHVSRVLRMRAGESLQIFTGTGGCYLAEITSINHPQVAVMPHSFTAEEVESTLQISLVQGISRGRHMDYTIQKAVELGVTGIIPVVTERSNVHLPEQRIAQRLAHWRGIIISACEQCGRNRIPEIAPPRPFAEWLAQGSAGLKIVLAPGAHLRLSDLSPRDSALVILSGPEGGLSDGEVQQVLRDGYQAINLGPRILRTETAALAAVSACQTLWGDMNRR